MQCAFYYVHSSHSMFHKYINACCVFRYWIRLFAHATTATQEDRRDDGTSAAQPTNKSIIFLFINVNIDKIDLMPIYVFAAKKRATGWLMVLPLCRCLSLSAHIQPIASLFLNAFIAAAVYLRDHQSIQSIASIGKIDDDCVCVCVLSVARCQPYHIVWLLRINCTARLQVSTIFFDFKLQENNIYTF